MREDTHLEMLAVTAGKAGSAPRFLMTGDGSKTVYQGGYHDIISILYV